MPVLIRRFLRGAAWVAAFVIVPLSARAQAPVQFQAELKVRDADGHSGSAKLYVGASKLRMDFQVSGESRPTIIDPRNETQFTISPKQKNYMEMPLGESGGTVRIPRVSTLNPANPCSNDRFADCKRLGPETINGYATEKWEYTNVDGDRETAWISTKLRFPIRTSTANGATTEIANVVEGPQIGTLFEVPRGYAKVDDIGGSDTPTIDAAMLQKAMEMAKAMSNAGLATGGVSDNRGRGAPPAPARPASASAYEGGHGWVLNATITAKGTTDAENKEFASKRHTTSSVKYTASIPLNLSAPGMPVMGPQWYLLALPGSGTPEAEAAPLTVTVENRTDDQGQTRAACDGEIGNSDTTSVTTEKGQLSSSIAKANNQLQGTAIWKFNPAITSYSLTVQILVIGNQADQVTTRKTIDHCAGDKVTNNTTTRKIDFGGFAFGATDVPAPTNPAAEIKGTTTIPWTNLSGTNTATVEWTIARIR